MSPTPEVDVSDWNFQLWHTDKRDASHPGSTGLGALAKELILEVLAQDFVIHAVRRVPSQLSLGLFDTVFRACCWHNPRLQDKSSMYVNVCADGELDFGDGSHRVSRCKSSTKWDCGLELRVLFGWAESRAGPYRNSSTSARRCKKVWGLWVLPTMRSSFTKQP